jgi:hypothetical protein
MKTTTIFIIADAMRSDYINKIDTPLLSEMSEKGIFCPDLKSSPGFTQRTAIFGGAHPKNSGNFAMYTFDSGNSPFKGHGGKFLKLKYNLMNYLYKKDEAQIFSKKSLNYLFSLMIKLIERFLIIPTKNKLNKYAKGKAVHAPLGNIPLHLLDRYGVSEDQKPLWEKDGMPVETIFDVLINESKSYSYLCYPVVDGDDNSTIEAVKNDLAEHKDVYFFQFSRSDTDPHIHGTESLKRHKVMGEIDRQLRDVKETAEAVYDNVNWVIVGDHGMTDVKNYIDLEFLIKKISIELNAKAGKDFDYWLDSTMFRMNIMSEKGNSLWNSIIKNDDIMNYFYLWDDKFDIKYNVVRSKKYGELVLWAKPGSMIYPDFFHKPGEKYKAMHGYEISYPSALGCAIVFNSKKYQKKIVNDRNLIDVCPTLCDVIGINYPSKNEGKSLISQV